MSGFYREDAPKDCQPVSPRDIATLGGKVIVFKQRCQSAEMVAVVNGLEGEPRTAVQLSEVQMREHRFHIRALWQFEWDGREPHGMLDERFNQAGIVTLAVRANLVSGDIAWIVVVSAANRLSRGESVDDVQDSD